MLERLTENEDLLKKVCEDAGWDPKKIEEVFALSQESASADKNQTDANASGVSAANQEKREAENGTGQNAENAADTLAVIDFQDMVRGPLGYDTASLVYDCYVRLDEPLAAELIDRAGAAFKAAGMLSQTADFATLGDECALQRHLKVLGIFVRLYLRDGKKGYLKDLPRVLAYACAECRRVQGAEELLPLLEGPVRSGVEQLACMP